MVTKKSSWEVGTGAPGGTGRWRCSWEASRVLNSLRKMEDLALPWSSSMAMDSSYSSSGEAEKNGVVEEGKGSPQL